MKRKCVVGFSNVFIILTVLFLQCLPVAAQDKKTVLFPLAFQGDPSMAFLQQGVRSMLISRLSGSGIVIVADEAIDTILEKHESKEVRSPDKAAELGTKTGADYALMGSITVLGGNYSLDIAVLNLAETRPEAVWISKTAAEEQFFARVDEVANAAKMVITNGMVAATVQPVKEIRQKAASPVVYTDDQKSTQEENGPRTRIKVKPYQEAVLADPDGTLELEMEIMVADTGDLDGDGQMELVVLSSKEVVVYTRSQGRFELKDRMKRSFGQSFIQLSVGDTDGNGRDEVCIVAVKSQQAKSSIWKWTGKFEKLYELEGHLRITPAGEKKKEQLLYQESQPVASDFSPAGYGLWTWTAAAGS